MDNEGMIFINARVSIPVAELKFRFSTSGGPGGQHANRSATRATLLFDVASSPSLNKTTRARLLRKLASRLDKQGVLRIDAQESRSQYRNRETAILRFQLILANALKKPKKRRKTKPSQAAVQKRLDNKKKRGQRKRERRRTWD
ncbi:MAG: aminoacyl-tRNA hydrolase [Chloroflexi bacterium]|nr:aminoacyl-tRNA hydrolase [Chloroflexota bacterium]